MSVNLALILTFAAGLLVRLQGKPEFLAWLLSSLIMPAFVLVDTFALPYRGGGASMWPVALVMGSFVGSLVGGLGVVVASFYLRKQQNSQKRP